MSICFIKHQQNVYGRQTNKQQDAMPFQQGICSRSPSKSMNIKLIEWSRAISISPSSNNIPSSSSYDPGRKIKALPEEKSDDESPVGIGGDYSLSPLVIGGYLNMGNVSGGNGSMNSHLIYQQDWDFIMAMWVVEMVL